MTGNKITMITAFLFMIITMTGLASASCPANVDRSTTTIADVKETFSGDNVTYSLVTTAQSSSNGVPGVMELCIYPAHGFNGTKNDLMILYPNWTDSIGPGNKKPYGHIGFVTTKGNKNNIPLDGSFHDVATVNYNIDGIPGSRVILLHINDKAECEKNNIGVDREKDDTCWRKPGKQPPIPIPEFPNIALPVTAVLVLMFIRKRMSESWK